MKNLEIPKILLAALLICLITETVVCREKEEMGQLDDCLTVIQKIPEKLENYFSPQKKQIDVILDVQYIIHNIDSCETIINEVKGRIRSKLESSNAKKCRELLKGLHAFFTVFGEHQDRQYFQKGIRKLDIQEVNINGAIKSSKEALHVCKRKGWF